jgi:DNA-binding winged helix-turn-helix (wHTH) protein/Tol biopolymer transport system component
VKQSGEPSFPSPTDFSGIQLMQAAPTLRLVRFESFEVDLRTRELRRNGEKVKLPEQSFQVLAMLLAAPGEVVMRQEIQKRLWPHDTVVEFENSINAAVKNLRLALGDSADQTHYIETLPRRGYRFIVPVSLHDSGKAAAASESPALPPSIHKELTSARETITSKSEPTDMPVSQRHPASFPYGWLPVGFALILIALALGYGLLRGRSRIAAAGRFEALRMTKLTNSGRAEDVAISPDGSYVVYSQRDQAGVGLWVRHLASGSDAQILPSDDVDFRGLTFSPDGNSIYFVRSRKEIGSFKDLYTIPMLGGPPQLLVKDIDSPVSFSPDGHQFVYTVGMGPPFAIAIRVANADGGNNHVLTTITDASPNFQAGASWSPDGRTIAESFMLRGNRSGYALDAISASDGSIREVLWHPDVIGRPMWLPYSSAVLVELDDPTGLGQLWVISLPRGTARRVTNDLANWGIGAQATRDGQIISAIQWSVTANIWSAPAANPSRIHAIARHEMPMVAAVPALDGRILAVSGTNQLWIMHRDGSALAPFSTLSDVAPPVVCGNFVITTSHSFGVFRTQEAAPGTLKGTKLGPGRLIVHRSYQSGPVSLVRVDKDGMNPAKLAEGYLYSPTCALDGKLLYFVQMEGPQKILRLPIEGGPPQIVGDIPGQSIRGTMRVSPDGRLLAFPYDEAVPTQISKVAVISVQTGQTVRTFDAPGGIYRESCLRWSPNGKSLQYLLTKGEVTNIWEQPLSGGPPHQLTDSTEGRIFDFNWTPDGKQLLLSRGEVISDVVLLSNLQ